MGHYHRDLVLAVEPVSTAGVGGAADMPDGTPLRQRGRWRPAARAPMVADTMTAAPPITGLAWGRIEIAGHPPFKDAKVYPGGARAWDWRETGTHHVPGIQAADVEELVDKGATTLVLSRGVWRRLEVAPETLSWLAAHNIDVRVLQTEDAVKCFNELREIVPLGGLFHSTC